MIEVKSRATIITQNINTDINKSMEGINVADQSKQIGKYPYVYYKGLIIQYNYISNLIIINSKFLPEIEIYFDDPTYKIIDPLIPVDDDVISIFIQSPSEKLFPIRMDFKIIDFVNTKDNTGKQGSTYYIKGILNVSELFYSPFKAYSNKTSFNVLKDIAQEAQLGFATNISDTDDKMTWINPNEANMDFITDHVLKHSYKSDNSFLWAFIDFYYNLNYIDIEVELNEDTDKKQLSSKRIFDGDKKDLLEQQILTNHPDKYNSSLFINSWNLVNSSTKINLDIGYRSTIYYYDKNKTTVYKVNLDTISTTGKDNVGIIMKGKIGDFNTLYNNATTTEYIGKQDSDNVHSKYLLAERQNGNNIKFLQKVKIKIIIYNLNLNLYRFQNINMELYKMEELDSSGVKSLETAYTDKLNKSLSGDWLITGINFNFSMTSGNSQEITLVKREINLSI